jgi:hypothetical protein
MTIVNIVLTQPKQDGTLSPAKGVLRFTPTARRVIDGTVVLPIPFQAPLVEGAATVELEPTTLAWIWRIDEHVSGSTSRATYVTVPDVLDIDYTDLAPIDPATLAPAPSADPAWLAALTELSAATITPDPDDPGFFLIGAS